MYSFYGGPQGQSFKFSAIFPNRVALAEDLLQTGFSPVSLNEFVFISYGLQNGFSDVTKGREAIDFSAEKQKKQIEKDSSLTIQEKLELIKKIEANAAEAIEKLNYEFLLSPSYQEDRQKDLDKYFHSYNSTLWQKIYKKDLKLEDEKLGRFIYHNDTYYLSDIEGYDLVNSIDNQDGYCYICLGAFVGYTPIFDVHDQTLVPAKRPTVSIDNSDIEHPELTFYLPRAAQFHGVNTRGDIDPSLDPLAEHGYGDYFFEKEKGKIRNAWENELVQYVPDVLLDELSLEHTWNEELENPDDYYKFSRYFIPEEKDYTKQHYSVKLPYVHHTVGDVEAQCGDPQISIEETNKYNHKLNFKIPYVKIDKVFAELVGQGQNPTVVVTEPVLTKDKYYQNITFGIPSGQGLEILSAITVEKIDDVNFVIDNNFIKSYLPSSIEVYQVQPIVFSQLQEDDSYKDFSYWCTYNNGWSILPLGGGGTARLEWEELGN